MKQCSVLILFISLFLFSCTKNNVIPDQNPPAPGPSAVVASTQLNVAYGTDALQKMDVYLPAGRTTAATKVMIVIHGGSWSAGDKTDMNTYIDSLKKRLPGYAVLNLNYRLASPQGNTFPVQETDVKAALDFINGKRSEYLISDKFVLLGASAGAHLSLLQAYKYATPKIKAVVDFFGPADLADMYNNPASAAAPPGGIAFLLNGTPTSNAPLYTSSGPINFITSQSPPTIILHGGQDPLLRFQQSIMLRDKLVFNGVAQQYVFYSNEGHSWGGANLTDSFDKIQAFLNQYVP